MTVKEMAQTLGLKVLAGEGGLEKKIIGGYTSDC